MFGRRENPTRVYWGASQTTWGCFRRILFLLILAIVVIALIGS